MEVHEIIPGLFQSRTPATPEDADFTDPQGQRVEINCIVDLEGGIDPVVPQGELADVYLYWPILDGPLPDERTLRTMARFVSGLLDSGYRVLVHCKAGKNRASLLSGRVMIERGIEPEEAVRLLRERRAPDVLRNQAFLDWLLREGSRV
jgi:hypothetical protein